MVRYGFFNSINGDRTYNADDVSDYMGLFYSDGIAKGLDAYPSSHSAASSYVTIDSGTALINGKYVTTDSEITFEIPSNNTNDDRIDYIYAYCNKETRECGFGYTSDLASLDTPTFSCIGLHAIIVYANTSYIQQDNITTINKSTLRVKTLENIKKIYYNATLNDCTVTSSSSITLTFLNGVMAQNIATDNGYFNIFIAGALQKPTYYNLTHSGNTVTITFNAGSYVYAKENNNFGQDIVIEHVYLDIDT